MDWLDLLAVPGTLKSLLQSGGNAIAPSTSQPVFSGSWTLFCVPSLNVQPTLAPSFSPGCSHSGSALCTAGPVPEPRQALALSGAARLSPTAACQDPRACSDHPCPPALPSLLFRTLSSCPGSGDHLGQGLRALAREEYCPGTKGAERAGWHEAETKASVCSSGMEDERKHLS